jgi:hypothetical protein
MSGKKKKAKKAAKKAEEQAWKDLLDITKDNWQQYSQWKYEAGQARDEGVQAVDRKYGKNNTRLRDILVAEEDRKYNIALQDLEGGSTKGQLTNFYKEKQGDLIKYQGGQFGGTEEQFLSKMFGEFTPEAEQKSPGDEAAAKGGAAGRVPRDAGLAAVDEGEEYFGW